jgi:hypothetical protein
MLQELVTKRQQAGSSPLSEKAVETNANESSRQGVKQETPQELFWRKRHHSFLISVSIILPAESHLVLLEGDEAMIGDGHAVGVAGEISSSVGLSGTSRSRPPYALLNANHHALAVDVGDF